MLNRKYLLISLISSCLSLHLSAQKIITNYWPRTKVIGEQYQIDGYGQKNGFYKEYNKFGTLIRHFNYLDGKEHGLCIEYITMRGGEYYECDGKAMIEKVMNNGNVVYEKEFSCLDGKYYMFQKREANKDGSTFTYTEYYPSGKISKKYGMTFNLNKLGPYTDYYENGNVKESGNYIKTENYNSVMDGHFYSIGEKKDTLYSVWFDNNYPVMGRFYYENGKLKDYIKLTDDYESQIVRHYDDKGTLERSSIFRAFPVSKECPDGTEVLNRKDAISKSGSCERNIYNPYDLNADLNRDNSEIFLEIDSIFENGTLKSVDVQLPYQYENDFGKTINSVVSANIKKEIDDQNNITTKRNLFYKKSLDVIKDIRSKFFVNNAVVKKNIYNAINKILKDYLFGDHYVMEGRLTRTDDTRLGTPGYKYSHFLKPITLYYTDYLSLYTIDSTDNYFSLIKSASPELLSSDNDRFEFDESFKIDNLVVGAEFAGSYIGAGTYYKLISIEKPRTAENDLYNSADEFFAKLMSAADRLLTTQDTKDLEKQLKAAANTADMKKILGI